MSRPLPPVVTATVSSESLLPPAIKAVSLGFVGGVIALLALMVLAPSLMQFDETQGRGSSHAANVRR
jgi:hypothetical protein